MYSIYRYVKIKSDGPRLFEPVGGRGQVSGAQCGPTENIYIIYPSLANRPGYPPTKAKNYQFLLRRAGAIFAPNRARKKVLHKAAEHCANFFCFLEPASCAFISQYHCKLVTLGIV